MYPIQYLLLYLLLTNPLNLLSWILYLLRRGVVRLAR
jgi:hypothetical protein